MNFEDWRGVNRSRHLGSLTQGLDRIITVSAGCGHDEGVGQHRGQKPVNGRLRGGT